MDTVKKEGSLPHYEASPGPPTLIECTLDFGHVPQGSQRTLQQIIANSTKKPMIWLVDACESRWLTMEPDHGILQPGEQQSIRVTADTSTLEVGEHSVTLTFSSEGDETSMSTDTLSKVIVETPQKALTPLPLEAGLHFGWLTPKSTNTLGLVISNPDDRPIKWQIQIGNGKSGMAVRETLEHGRRQPGIQENFSIKKVEGVMLSKSEGELGPGMLETIFVTASAAKLKSSYSYTTNLTLSSQVDGRDSTSVQVPIMFYVNMHPFNDGGPKVPKDLPLFIALTIPHLQSDGTANLSFTNNNPGTVYWTLAPDSGWLVPNPSSGQFDPNETARVVLTAQRKGLTVGSHTTNLNLNLSWDPSMNPPNTPVSRPLFLTVQ
jgi:HYDIN/CFA65/VesB family protein/BACON domain-containing protein